MKKLLILGNATSRLKFEKEINSFDGEIWGCNRIYLELGKNIDRLDQIVTVHHDEAIKALKYKKDNDCNYKIIMQEVEESEKKELLKFKKYRGFSSGLEALHEAIINNDFDEIYLCGFCFINGDQSDIYTKNLITCNFMLQWQWLKEEFPNKTIKFLRKEKPSTRRK